MRLFHIPLLILGAVIAGLAWIYTSAVPKCGCSESSENWSWPFTGKIDGFGNKRVTYRVCMKHGTEWLYDTQQMRFLSKQETEAVRQSNLGMEIATNDSRISDNPDVLRSRSSQLPGSAIAS